MKKKEFNLRLYKHIDSETKHAIFCVNAEILLSVVYNVLNF